MFGLGTHAVYCSNTHSVNLLFGRLFCTHACIPWPSIQNGTLLLKVNYGNTMSVYL